VSLLVNADLLTALAPVMDGLREFNIKVSRARIHSHHILINGVPSSDTLLIFVI